MIAILTGDIISSRKSKDFSKLLSDLKSFLTKYGENEKDWEIFRGDSFQLKVPEPEESLYRSIHIKSLLKKEKNIDVRIAIGIGEDDDNTELISEASSSAYVRSGHCFEELGKQALKIRSPWKEFDEEFNLFFKITGLIMDNWLVTSAEFIHAALEDTSQRQSDIAQILGISQSGVSDRSRRSAYDEIMLLEKRFRNQLKNHMK